MTYVCAAGLKIDLYYTLHVQTSKMEYYVLIGGRA